ncbi:DNA mismatch repair endonuclease MutL [Ferviditalea candida]|uniref:DNA mismatch repair protein MutL n=1 Tax=Ferviditalea candida TaxID=3108399 RepID=A0ABU5ZJM8_9BACL|nr:DNA mismatch repair endonuclease MutL [Paenibacillaceae bacterium T2]
MGRIHVLDAHIANQIAAGEVVERPSSVVKELVENAIDAGSTRIDIQVEEGGIQLIRVTDNGSGIEADDCERAFLRHATSKISTGKDLFRIRSLGFRGEALPSIAAVSRLECVSSSKDNGLGRRIVIEGGSIKAAEDVPAQKGTDFIVKDLFYNTPARLKYMKTIQTELGHISDYVYRIALAYPDIAFSLAHNGSSLLRTLGNGDTLQVIAAVYGTSVARGMIGVNGENADYVLSGYISKPEITRASRSAVSLIVNGRYIRNYAVTQSIVQAYHTLLPIHRFPVAVLNIRMDPSLLDVNVHPSKLEVRFSKESELLKFIEHELAGKLKKQALIPEVSKPAVRSPVIQEQLELYRHTDIPSAGLSRAADAELPKSDPPRTDDQLKSEPPKAADRREIHNGFETTYRAQPSGEGLRRPQAEHSKKPEFSDEQLKPLYVPIDEPAAASVRQHFPKLYPIGQMRGTYIIAQNEDGLFLIDQHAAHERINYEYYYGMFGNPAAASQDLLVPIPLEFTPSDAAVIREKLYVFEQAGVYLEPFGGNTFIVRSCPHWMPSGQEKEIIEEMVEWVLAEKKSLDIAKIREKAAILCSCKASIRANENLSMLEIESLLARLASCRNPYTCPHGRPIVISFSNYELEKMFKRVM